MRSEWTSTDYGKIPSSWEQSTIGEICTLITDGAHKSPKQEDSGYFMASVKDMRYNYFDFSNCKTIAKKDFDELLDNRCSPEQGDILISKDGANCLDIIFVYKQPERIVLLSSIAIARLKPDFLPDFFRYFLLAPGPQAMMRNNYVSGSAIPRIVLKDFKNVPVPLPPLPTQRAIAHILGSLDDKITLLRQMNETLEQLAQALFQSWFVDFDPVIDKALAAGHEIPEPLHTRAARRQALGDRRKALPAEVAALFPDRFQYEEELGWVPAGWEVKAVSELGNVITGKTPPSKHPEYFGDELPFVTPSDFKNYHKFVLSAGRGISEAGTEAFVKKVLPANSVLVTCIGSNMGKVVINKVSCLTNQQINSVIPFEGQATAEFLYHYFLSIYEDLRNLAFGGSTMPILNKSEFGKISVPMPPFVLLEALEIYIEDLGNTLTHNQYQIQTLTSLRDTLLPKLISGELSVAEAEEQINEDEP